MKRILCPKCENYLSFDETKYSEGQSLVFVCEHCGKQFSIRLGKSKMKAPRKEEKLDEDVYKEEFGCIVVIENVFGFNRSINICTYTTAANDIINVKRNRQGELVYTLRDAPSLTGTFLMNEILGDKDRIRIDDGAIITIGATTAYTF